MYMYTVHVHVYINVLCISIEKRTACFIAGKTLVYFRGSMSSWFITDHLRMPIAAIKFMNLVQPIGTTSRIVYIMLRCVNFMFCSIRLHLFEARIAPGMVANVMIMLHF